MNDFFNFSYKALNLLDNKIHDNIKGSFIDNFIHELQNHLEFQSNDKILENLPKNTNLHFARFEGNFAICFDYSSKIIYNIPKSYLKGETPETGEALKKVSSKDFRVDYTGIPANANNIDNLLNECRYATLSTKTNILPEYYKISDIGVDFAVCKNLNTNKPENIPIDDIPKNAKNGDTLIYKAGRFIIK
ncbi:MAG: hypothetical protein IKT41_03625 [Clostridia bacterium]|nr:hypothetical protein [Clostridia bacterium]